MALGGALLRVLFLSRQHPRSRIQCALPRGTAGSLAPSRPAAQSLFRPVVTMGRIRRHCLFLSPAASGDLCGTRESMRTRDDANCRGDRVCEAVASATRPPDSPIEKANGPKHLSFVNSYLTWIASMRLNCFEFFSYFLLLEATKANSSLEVDLVKLDSNNNYATEVTTFTDSLVETCSEGLPKTYNKMVGFLNVTILLQIFTRINLDFAFFLETLNRLRKCNWNFAMIFFK